MNTIIALVGFVGIVAARKLSRQTETVDFKKSLCNFGNQGSFYFNNHRLVLFKYGKR